MAVQIPDMNLFMMCESLNASALRNRPPGFHIRHCCKNELNIWKAMPFDDPVTAGEYSGYMTDYFNAVYADKGDLFFKRCLFICDNEDRPVGTCFLWKAYDSISTIHWFKVIKGCEGMGLGRALLSTVMQDTDEKDYPIYLHTQPSSFRAIKLYSDFGFCFLSDPMIGNRQNDLPECIPILKDHMPESYFDKLRIAQAPAYFLETVRTSNINQF